MKMDEQTIEKVVEKVMRKLEHCDSFFENKDSKPTFLIVKNQSTNCYIIKHLKRKANVIELTNEEEEIPKIVEKVLFLDATQDLFVKGALGITDTKEAYILSNAIRLGLSVKMIPSESFEWVHYISNKKKTSSYDKMFIQYMDSLNNFGVQVIDYKNLLKLESVHFINGDNKYSDHINEKLLTKDIVERIQTNKINISESTLVTPLARDTAKELQKEIYVNGIKEEKI